MRRFFPALALIALFLSFANAKAQERPSFIEGGVLRICTNPTLPPMTFVNGADLSALDGFDIALARALGAYWRVPVKFETMDFTGLFPSLSAGRCGLVISGVLKQASREHLFDAVSYLETSPVIVAPARIAPVTSFEALAGQSLAVESGTSYAARIEDINRDLTAQGKPPIALQQYPSEDQVVQQVLVGRVQNFLSQDVELFYREAQLGGKLHVIYSPKLPGYTEFALYLRRAGSDRALLASALDALRQKGEITALEKKWNVGSAARKALGVAVERPRFNTTTFFSALFSMAFLKGAGMTLAIALASHAAAIVLSIPIALKLNAPRSLWHPFLRAYVAIFRGAPTLLQLLFIWNALPQFFPIFRESWFSPFLATWICLSINESAYQVEINRAALSAIDPGQLAGGQALGMSQAQIYRHVIFPQALRVALPPTINEFISLLKTTSLASVISLQELLFITQVQVARSFEFTEYYAAALVYYLAMVFAFLHLQKRIETRFVWASRDGAGRKSDKNTPTMPQGGAPRHAA
ncbi:ABC transporter substrate-binding protein/permease [Asaia sp. HN010]|uniref:ABC transporter substrate-binding protein/permease n=1 Tax=Asaia sp. HN010 TaxID=3081233 RepID=UPI00301926ED